MDPLTVTAVEFIEHPDRVILSPDRFSLAFAIEDA
jgi:hypothetical protein